MKNGCASCHGLEGQGAPTSGPRIGPNPLPLAAFIKYVRAPKNQMPPYTAKVMSDQELTDVRAFLAARAKPAAAQCSRSNLELRLKPDSTHHEQRIRSTHTSVVRSLSASQPRTMR